MKDPARIARVMAKLHIAWTVGPGMDQQRFGQLLYNVLSRKPLHDVAFWFVGDDVLERELDEWIAKHKEQP